MPHSQEVRFQRSNRTWTRRAVCLIISALALSTIGLTGATAGQPSPSNGVNTIALETDFAIPFPGSIERRASGKARLNFDDIASDHLFAKEIMWLADKGITAGYDDGTFRPLNKISREAMAAFLYRYAGEPAFNTPTISPFEDVPTSHTFYKEITWLEQQDITSGYDDGSFRPQNRITREAMAAFLYRFHNPNSFTPDSSAIFPDAPRDHKFYTEISWLAENEISTGYPDGTFRPRGEISREATAAFLFRLDKLENPTPIPEITSKIVTPEILSLVNKERTAAGAGKLKADACANRFAKKQAEEQARTQTMFHQDMSTIMSECGANGAGENVAYGYANVGAVHDAWMTSPGHRANILNRKYTGVGTAVAWGRSGRLYYAQVFVK